MQRRARQTPRPASLLIRHHVRQRCCSSHAGTCHRYAGRNVQYLQAGVIVTLPFLESFWTGVIVTLSFLESFWTGAIVAKGSLPHTNHAKDISHTLGDNEISLYVSRFDIHTISHDGRRGAVTPAPEVPIDQKVVAS